MSKARWCNGVQLKILLPLSNSHKGAVKVLSMEMNRPMHVAISQSSSCALVGGTTFFRAELYYGQVEHHLHYT